MKKITSVIIIGSGFGGQCAAINLIKRDIHDFRILERRTFMGGTWAQNHYPGAAVDVQSPLYSLSFEPYPWSQMFAEQKELNAYTQHVIDKYNLQDKTDTQTNVEKIEWNNNENLWDVHTNSGLYKAKSIINASGPLSTPITPSFKGKDSFKGTSFHTNNWDKSYDYKNKRVAIIGSGASAAQIIPSIAPDVDKLHVFQRSPHWVLPRPDRTFSPFQQKLLANKTLYKILRVLIYWSLETRIIGFKYSHILLKLFAQKKAKRFIKKTIKDPVLRKKVTPDYTIGCKRIILSNTLYPALCRDNTTLYDQSQGITEINETGIVTHDGQQVDVDLIVYSTGYDATDGVISYPVVGKEGCTLASMWEEFPRAYLGTSMPSFPNFFIVTGPNTGIGHTSAIHIIESQMNYIMDVITTLKDGKHRTIEIKKDAEQSYTEMIHLEMKNTVWEKGGCNSWYQSNSGKVIAMFPGFSFRYRALTKKMNRHHHIIN
jgi:cation diffusion facilitator CzcD-associated flavoprotein CzcO